MQKTLLLSLMLAGSTAAFAGDFTRYVDPFIGSIGTGHTFPGACVPFGLVQASPVTGSVGWNYCSEYVGTDRTIWGFTQTHLNGTGCMDLGDVLIMPATLKGVASHNAADYRSAFSKSSESARPGYYSVFLDGPRVKAEVTSTPHAGVYRFTFDDPANAALFIDLNHAPAWNEKQYHTQTNACEVQMDDEYTLSGHVRNTVWVEQDYWFVMRFSHPVAKQEFLKMEKGEKGKRIVNRFSLKKGEQLGVTVALSSYSLDGARRNLQTEMGQLAAGLQPWGQEPMPLEGRTPELPDNVFDSLVEKADATWDSYLGRVEIDGTDDQKKNFYTGFYHALIQPNNIADVDGSYRDSKGNPAHTERGTEYFSTFSCWDTYRAAHPFYTLLVPEKVDPFVRSLVSFAESEGHLPIWGLCGRDNYCMVANHAVSIVAEAYHKGFRDFDADRAFEAIKRTQTVSHPLKSNWEVYTKYGYFPTDLTEAESVSSTLENVYDDYAAADMARLMGRSEDAAYFADRATWYKNLFDPETRFMRPRLADGTWKTPFDPAGLAHAESSGGDYTEGNAWQYTWHVQHDVDGLIELLGGKKEFIKRLDTFFTTKLESTLSDVTGLIGQYAHGNEPSHHVTYFYTLAGQPRRTAELIREIFDTQYLPKADGLCGNDDCGQMSAWYMLSAMGFYPVDPVSARYVFGAPQMKHFTLHLDNAKTFEIEARGLSEENKYVKKILLNGKTYKKNYIEHADIVRGGKLTYIMGK